MYYLSDSIFSLVDTTIAGVWAVTSIKIFRSFYIFNGLININSVLKLNETLKKAYNLIKTFLVETELNNNDITI